MRTEKEGDHGADRPAPFAPVCWVESESEPDAEDEPGEFSLVWTPPGVIDSCVPVPREAVSAYQPLDGQDGRWSRGPPIG